MILKMHTVQEQAHGVLADCWTYIDHVESATVYYDSENEVACISIHLKDSKSEEDPVLALHDAAYLCNDRGQTIEKLYPAVIQARVKNSKWTKPKDGEQ